MYILFCLATQQQYQQNVFEEIDDAFCKSSNLGTNNVFQQTPMTC